MSEPSFELKCDSCGGELDGEFKRVSQYREGIMLEITPCPKCIEDAKADGRIEGKESVTP